MNNKFVHICYVGNNIGRDISRPFFLLISVLLYYFSVYSSVGQKQTILLLTGEAQCRARGATSIHGMDVYKFNGGP